MAPRGAAPAVGLDAREAVAVKSRIHTTAAASACTAISSSVATRSKRTTTLIKRMSSLRGMACPEARQLVRLRGGLRLTALKALTQREREIIERLGRGELDQEIVAALSIGIHTVRSHVRNARRGTRARSRERLVGIGARAASGAKDRPRQLVRTAWRVASSASPKRLRTLGWRGTRIRPAMCLHRGHA